MLEVRGQSAARLYLTDCDHKLLGSGQAQKASNERVVQQLKDVAMQGLDHVLMATGRKPNTHNLGLEEVCGPALPFHSSCLSTLC